MLLSLFYDAKGSQLSPVNSSWYTLDGRRLKGKPKMQGFFIQGGIKYLFR